jgi:ATP synthase protein I
MCMMREVPDVPPVGSSTEQDARDNGNTNVRTKYRQDQWDVEQDNNIVPLTRAEAEKLFGPSVGRPLRVTPLKVVAAQMVLSLVVALVWWLFSDHPGQAALSALLGGAICWIPSSLFALRLKGVGGQTSTALIVVEAIKTGVTIAMFIAVAMTYHEVRWVPLLVTYLVALKTYWVALAFN